MFIQHLLRITTTTPDGKMVGSGGTAQEGVTGDNIEGTYSSGWSSVESTIEVNEEGNKYHIYFLDFLITEGIPSGRIYCTFEGIFYYDNRKQPIIEVSCKDDLKITFYFEGANTIIANGKTYIRE